MRKMVLKAICIAACLFVAGNAFLPIAGAIRSKSIGESPAAISHTAQVSSAISGEFDLRALRRFEVAKSNSKEEYRKSKLGVGHISMPPSNDELDDEIPDDLSDDEFYVSDTWILGAFDRTLTSGSPQSSMNRVTLALASTSQRNISIVASASASGVMDKMGVCIIRLQRYYKGRWVSVSTITNRYSYHVTYFLYSNVQSSAVSGYYYRVTATFIADNGSYENCVTRTSRSIRCQ